MPVANPQKLLSPHYSNPTLSPEPAAREQQILLTQPHACNTVMRTTATTIAGVDHCIPPNTTVPHNSTAGAHCRNMKAADITQPLPRTLTLGRITLLMTHQRVVAHCLALYGHYSGTLTQADKDFFDARVEQTLNTAEDAFLAVLLLLTMRLQLELPEERAETTAQELANEHEHILKEFLPAVRA